MSKKSKPRPSRRGGVPSERTATDASGAPSRKPRRRGPVIAAILVLTATAAAIVTWRGSRGTAPTFPPAGAAKGFNLLIVTLDTTRADRMGYHGYAGAATPTLDRLAREGVAYMNAISPVPVTLPAHSSLFTGLDPQNHGVRNNGAYRLEDRHVTLAEVLKTQGYDTAAFVSAFVLDARFGLGQGFDTYDDHMELITAGPFGSYDSERIAGSTTDAAIAWLEARPGDKPYFVWVHYFDPHERYQPPADYAARFSSAPYDGEIAYMDAEFGRLLRQVERRAQDRPTLVVVVGDHGESLGEHGVFGHGRFLYETTQHIPFVVWCPAVFPRGSVVEGAAVSLVDVFPTVLDLLGAPHTDSLDGISLRHAQTQPHRALYMETLVTYLENGWAPLHALRRAADKYIFAPKPEYYDLALDPGEQTNLAGSNTSAASAIASLANQLAERMKDSPSAEAVAAAAVALDPDALRRLESLGYLGGTGAVPVASGEALANPRDMIPVHALFRDGMDLARAGQFEAAAAKVNAALQASPNDQAMLRSLAAIYLRMNRPLDAEVLLRQSIEIQPTTNTLVLLGQILIVKGQFAEAERALLEARTLEPADGSALIATGDLRLAQGRAAEARALYEEAIRIDPSRAAGAAKGRLENLRRQLGEP